MKNQYNTALTSERVKSRAKEIGMTISQLNLICELSENTIKNAGKSAEGMKARNLFAIAEALDCSADYLLGRTDKPETETEAETHIEQNHQFIQNDNSPIVLSVPAGTELDEMQKELLSRFGKLQFTDKIGFMQQLVEKTESGE